MQTNFLSKLYEIKPFKIVNSPEPNKYKSSSNIEKNSSNRKLLHLQSPIINKQNNRDFVKISELSLFTNLASSIDHLFSKIQKIKEEFEYKQGTSSAHKVQTDKKQKSSTKKKLNTYQPIKRYQTTKQNTGSHYCSAFSSVEPSEVINKKLSEDTNDSENLKRETSVTYHKTELQSALSNFSVLSGSANSTFQSVSRLSMRQFQLGRCVGSGKFGDVHMCIHKATQTVYALKKIFKSTIMEYNMIQQFLKELKIHYILNHPNITKLYTFFQDDYHVFLLMEYAKDGTLYEKFLQDKKEKINSLKREQQVSHAIFQVLNAVQFLHRKNIVHRDIKPQNIVIIDQTAKLCDFGWSATFDSQMKKTFCGTLDYLSPEMKDKGQYTTSVDLWSIGILTFELITGYPPFKKQMQKMKLKSSNKDGPLNKWKWDEILFPPQVSDNATDFIQGLLKQKPEQRISLRECLRHPFIVGHNEGAGESRLMQINRDACVLL